MIKIWCEGCGGNVPFELEKLSSDDLNGDAIWGDVVCPNCKLVIATITADEPGLYNLVKIADIVEDTND